MGCGKSKNAVATDNVIAKGKGKNPENNLPVAKPEWNENVKGNNETTEKTNGEVPGGIEEESSKPGIGETDGVTIPGYENKKSIDEVVPEGTKVEESRTNEVEVTGNQKEEIVPVADIKEESGKEVFTEADDPGNGESETSGKEISREGKGEGIEGPGSGESDVKSEAAATAVEEEKDERMNEGLQAADIAAVEEMKDESKNEESKAADVAAVKEKKDERTNEGSEAADVAAVEELKDENKNQESKAADVAAVEEKKEALKAENKEDMIKTQETMVSQDFSSKKDHEAETVEAIVPDATDGKPDNGEDISGKVEEEAAKAVETKESVTTDETKSAAITGTEETSTTKEEDATTATTDAKAN